MSAVQFSLIKLLFLQPEPKSLSMLQEFIEHSVKLVLSASMKMLN